MDDRPPPPQGPPPSYAFVTRVYKRSLRPVVLVVAFLGGLWSLFSGIGFFRNVQFYNRQNANALSVISIILGALYMAIAAIEAFGLFAAGTQRLGAARTYAWLSALVFILVAGIGLARVVIHFTLKQSIIDTCTNAADGASYVYTGFWGPVYSGTIDLATASYWCNRYWDRGSWSEIIAFIATSSLATLFASVAFGFYRQLLDPLSPSNAWRAPSNQARTEGYPSHYAPPYNAGGPAPYPTYGAYTPSHAPYSAYPAYAPPPGPPPTETKPPGYEGGWGYGHGAGVSKDDDKNPFENDAEHSARQDGASSRPAP